MIAGWRLRILMLGLVSLALGAGESLSEVIDPFLEEFRVGAHRDPARISLEHGWPADLFTSVIVDTLWLKAAADLFAEARPPCRHQLVAWRFLVPYLNDVEAQQNWQERHRQRLRMLDLARRGRESEVPVRNLDGFLVKETLCVAAINNYHNGDYDACHHAIMELLKRAEELALPPEEILIWSLRRRRVAELRAGAPDPEGGGVWTELLNLGPYDGQSGWAVWVAHRRARQQPLLPAGSGEKRLAVFLTKLSESWLTAQEIQSAGFSETMAAAVGGVCLPRGPELDAHLARHPSPPEDWRWQSGWISGQRSRQPGNLDKLVELAALPDLDPGYRLDLWRRASEAYLLKGQWDRGLAALSRAWELYRQKAGSSPYLKERLRQWSVQALALATAQGRKDRAAVIVGQARNQLAAKPQHLQEFLQATSGLRERLGWAAPVRANGSQLRLEQARQRVLAAGSPEVRWGARSDSGWPGPEARDALWQLWSRWGQNLVAAQPNDCHNSPCQDYLGGLRAVTSAATPTASFTLGCAAVGRFLRGRPFAEDVFRWALAHDLAVTFQGDIRTGPSPIPGILADMCQTAGLDRFECKLVKHALLGLCLALGDLRGQIALSVELPQGGLTLDERLRFLYPLPAPGPLTDAVRSADVEPALLLAIARNESLFDPAVRSRAGALGWLQIMPFHLPERGVVGGLPVWKRLEVSIGMGVHLLKENARRFAGDPYRTVAAYNAGGTAVTRWTRQLGGLPDRDLFLAWIGYPETRTYTEKVLIDREIYDWILGGEATGAVLLSPVAP